MNLLDFARGKPFLKIWIKISRFIFYKFFCKELVSYKPFIRSVLWFVDKTNFKCYVNEEGKLLSIENKKSYLKMRFYSIFLKSGERIIFLNKRDITWKFILSVLYSFFHFILLKISLKKKQFYKQNLKLLASKKMQ